MFGLFKREKPCLPAEWWNKVNVRKVTLTFHLTNGQSHKYTIHGTAWADYSIGGRPFAMTMDVKHRRDHYFETANKEGVFRTDEGKLIPIHWVAFIEEEYSDHWMRPRLDEHQKEKYRQPLSTEIE